MVRREDEKKRREELKKKMKENSERLRASFMGLFEELRCIGDGFRSDFERLDQLRKTDPDEFRRQVAADPILFKIYQMRFSMEKDLTERTEGIEEVGGRVLGKLLDQAKYKKELSGLSSPAEKPKPTLSKTELHVRKVKEFKEAADKIRAMFPKDPDKAEEFIEKLRSDLFEGEE